MEIKTAINYIRNIYPHPNFMVICYAYNKVYLLTWLGMDKETGFFRYGFQPIEKTAFYELGIGESCATEDGLSDYFIECLRREYKLYCAHSLAQFINNIQRLKDKQCQTLEPITKNEHYKGETIKIRLKEGTIVEGEIVMMET